MLLSQRSRTQVSGWKEDSFYVSKVHCVDPKLRELLLLRSTDLLISHSHQSVLPGAQVMPTGV